MTVSDRDKKILLFLVPLIVFGAYWFLLLSPKREEASTAADQLATQEQRLDSARARVDQLSSAKTDFAADYTELVRLGKAAPDNVDMPTLLVQLQAAADGTGVSFTSIATEEREPAVPVAATEAPADPADAGGEPAQSGPGTAAETAGDTAADADADAAAAEQTGVDTATSTPANDGALPVGGGTAPGAAVPAGTSGVAGLDAVGLALQFDGDFFGLANFFHRLKRYVEVSDNRLFVRGRLLTIDAISFTSTPETFPKLTAEITATAYLAPEAEGAVAGATPSGPTPADGQTVPAGSDTAAVTPPAAAATP